MNKRERPQYTGKYEVLGDVELVGEEAVEAERQIMQADSESKLRQTHFASGFDAGRASAQAEIERLTEERDQYRQLYESYKTASEELAADLAATRAVVTSLKDQLDAGRAGGRGDSIPG